MSKHILISSCPRSGNTFLSESLKKALSLNNLSQEVILSGHLHCSSILHLEQKENVKIYVIIRNPIDNIMSLIFNALYDEFKHKIKINKNIDNPIQSGIAKYSLFLKAQVDNNKAQVILFEDLINNTDYVLEKILNSIDIEYKNKINNKEIVEKIYSDDEKAFVSTNNEFSKAAYHVPHDIEKHLLYDSIRETVFQSKEFNEINDVYINFIESIASQK